MKKIKLLSSLLACTLLSPMFFGYAKAAGPDTELVFIIDKSGSMYHLTDDTIGSFNSVIQEQKDLQADGKVYVTTVAFSDYSTKIHDRKELENVEPITRADYRTYGCTALLDAVGETITSLSANESVKDNKVMFVIITDGQENASRRFSKIEVKKLIEEKTHENWEFLFLGANIDSVKEGTSIGIGAHSSLNFEASCDGIREAFLSASTMLTSIRNAESSDLKRSVANVSKENEDDANQSSDEIKDKQTSLLSKAGEWFPLVSIANIVDDIANVEPKDIKSKDCVDQNTDSESEDIPSLSKSGIWFFGNDSK